MVSYAPPPYNYFWLVSKGDIIRSQNASLNMYVILIKKNEAKAAFNYL